MKKIPVLAVLAAMLCACAPDSSIPYTVYKIDDGVYRIEDSNASNPAGESFDADGNKTHFNNCSDMYLINGRGQALLIDLSNRIDWADNAAEALRDIVYDRIGDRKLTITFTHNHGDHTGMLEAFSSEPEVYFALPRTDFKKLSDRFPEERSYLYDEEHEFDLGEGTVVESLPVPGHTAGSVVFFLDGRDIMFSGDAIGSGHGVWIFDRQGFENYVKGLNTLNAYLDGSDIDRQALRIFGGHFWQKDWFPELGDGEFGISYIEDMTALVSQICSGQAAREPSGLDHPVLDTYFRYGSAIVVWNSGIADEMFGAEGEASGATASR